MFVIVDMGWGGLFISSYKMYLNTKYTAWSKRSLILATRLTERHYCEL